MTRMIRRSASSSGDRGSRQTATIQDGPRGLERQDHRGGRDRAGGQVQRAVGAVGPPASAAGKAGRELAGQAATPLRRGGRAPTISATRPVASAETKASWALVESRIVDSAAENRCGGLQAVLQGPDESIERLPRRILAERAIDVRPVIQPPDQVWVSMTVSFRSVTTRTTRLRVRPSTAGAGEPGSVQRRPATVGDGVPAAEGRRPIAEGMPVAIDNPTCVTRLRPRALGSIERTVGLLHQRGEVADRRSPRRHPEARRHRAERPGERLDRHALPLGMLDGGGRVGIGEHDRELLAAVPRRRRRWGGSRTRAAAR